jgi:hypothetical protein
MVLHDPSLAGDYDGRYVYGYFCGGSAESLAGRVLTTDSTTRRPRDEGIGVGLGSAVRRTLAGTARRTSSTAACADHGPDRPVWPAS